MASSFFMFHKTTYGMYIQIALIRYAIVCGNFRSRCPEVEIESSFSFICSGVYKTIDF